MLRWEKEVMAGMASVRTVRLEIERTRRRGGVENVEKSGESR
jgi:hypothetical protein